MTLPSLLILLLLGAAGSWALTSSVRRYALHADLLDRPNERSSHTVPTPRGGGVAIVVSYLALVAVFALRDPGAGRLAAALLAAAAWSRCSASSTTAGTCPRAGASPATCSPRRG
jgi:Fuc2NAc and GlcNAc transferase